MMMLQTPTTVMLLRVLLLSQTLILPSLRIMAPVMAGKGSKSKVRMAPLPPRRPRTPLNRKMMHQETRTKMMSLPLPLRLLPLELLRMLSTKTPFQLLPLLRTPSLNNSQTLFKALLQLAFRPQSSSGNKPLLRLTLTLLPQPLHAPLQRGQ